MYVSWTSIEAGREFQTRVGIHIDARHHLIPFELLIIVALILPTSELRASPAEQIHFAKEFSLLILAESICLLL